VRQPDEERIHHGYFQVQNDIITFTSDSKKPDPLPYYIVPWDKRIYLLTENSSSGIHSFVSAIKSKEEPFVNSYGRHGFMVRMAPEEAPTSTSRSKPSRYVPKGLPKFPPQFQHLLQGIQRVEPKPKREKGTKKTEKH
jgi:hypothetical protein